MSSRATFFVQECPICGRKLRICVEYLGLKIQCRHCRAVFVAADAETDPSVEDGRSDLFERVNRLLGPEQTEQPTA